MKLSRRRFLLTAIPAVCLAVPRQSAARPLRQGARFSAEDRDRAVRRGLRFIYRLACVGRNFAEYGDDLLWASTRSR